jgi:hypothetical protein
MLFEEPSFLLFTSTPSDRLAFMSFAQTRQSSLLVRCSATETFGNVRKTTRGMMFRKLESDFKRYGVSYVINPPVVLYCTFAFRDENHGTSMEVPEYQLHWL